MVRSFAPSSSLCKIEIQSYLLFLFFFFCVIRCTRKPGPGEIPGYDGTIRVCHFCYNILQNPILADDIGKIIDTASTAAESSRASGALSDSDDPEAAEEELVSNTYERVSFTPARAFI